jgi:hypothetical protein
MVRFSVCWWSPAKLESELPLLYQAQSQFSPKYSHESTLARTPSRILAMSFFPRLSYLSHYGGELHRKGGVLLKARLIEWERELLYLRFRIAEWKEFGSVEHPDYYSFRAFLFQKVRNHLFFELKVCAFMLDDVILFFGFLVLDEGWIHSPQTLSSILVACEVAVDSDDVPPLQNYADSIYAFRERISPGEITRRIHLEDWHRYMRAKDEAVDTASEMEDMFARIRHEIGGMERRSAEFKRMVDELVRMVEEMPNIFTRINPSPANGFTTTDLRVAHAGARSRLVVRSPSDLTPTPLLANSRARLPPPLQPPAPSGSPRLPTAPGSPSAAAVLASISASASLNRLGQTTTAPSRTPPPPRAQRYAHFHRRFFHRAFFAPRTSNPPHPRTPSPRGTPSPPGTPALPGGPGFHETGQESSIAESRTRLPPPLETPPIPYRAPGQIF